MLRRILPYLIWAFYRLWTSTWRIRETKTPAADRATSAGGRCIATFWHGDELSLIGLHRRYRLAAMVSTSRDGDLMAKCLDLLGIKSSRGSSTRGGANALRGLCRLAQEGRMPVMTVDGPHGPYHKVKPGVFALSALLGAEICPIGVACSRAIVFAKSWNKAYLPLPFARVQVVWGQPLPALSREDDPNLDRLAADLERSLETLAREAAGQMAGAGTIRLGDADRGLPPACG